LSAKAERVKGRATKKCGADGSNAKIGKGCTKYAGLKMLEQAEAIKEPGEKQRAGSKETKVGQ